MNPSENASKISLSMLRGKSSNQSVPSISFRFNPGSDDLVKVEDKEDKGDILSSIIPEISPDKEKPTSTSGNPSPSRRESRGLNQRSSSLDGATSSPESTTATISTKSPDPPSLISRLTKTFEHKMNEIRNDKQKDSKQLQTKDNTDQGCLDSVSSRPTESEKLSFTSKTFESKKRISLDSKELAENSSSPSKTKTSLVQDFTEQKNKFKSDFNKNIRPRIIELRNRKSPKDGTSSPRVSSILQSLLRRDGILAEELLHECHAVDTAIEAQEDVQVLQELKNSLRRLSTDELSSGTEQTHIENAPPLNKESIIISTSQENLWENSTTLKLLLINILHEIFMKRKAHSMKFSLFFFVICFILPLPRFLAGLIFGVTVASLLFLFLLQLVMPKPPSTDHYHPDLPNEAIPKHEENQLYVGWMNELDGDYYPESYHVSQTHTVLLRLQGSILEIDNSRKKINKHARPNENLHYGVFVHHREYDLKGCEVVLLPKNLPRKWLWSRKYPIFIRLPSRAKRSPSPDSTASTPNRAFQDAASRPDSPGFPPSPHEMVVKHLQRSNTSPDDAEGSSESTEGNWSMENNRSAVEDDLMSSSLDLGSYEEVTQDMCQETSLCLFARTDREKDDWYRRFVFASEKKSNQLSAELSKETLPSSPSNFTSSTPEAEVSVPFEAPSSEADPDAESEAEDDSKQQKPLSFDQHMTRILQHDLTSDVGVSWFNVFVGRVFFDFLHDQFWANKIQERVQRKLSKLHIPYFVGEIVVSGVDLGSCVPQILSAERPTMDHRGLWVDLLVAYSGSFKMTIETKLDLMKLKVRSPSGGIAPGRASSSPPSPNETPPSAQVSMGRCRGYARSPSSDCVLRNVQFDTDTDDSVESSSEDEPTEDEMGERGGPGGTSGSGGPASKRFLRIVDTVTASRYFQQAAEWKVLQRAMKGVSNTRIELSVEIKRLKGTLALNVPPAPSDRLWYGFRGSPELVMVARPCLGDRQLDTLPFLADFIQKQLRTVFEKVFVLPNMDDLVIPIMSPLLAGQNQPLRPPWETNISHLAEGVRTPSPKSSSLRHNVSLDLDQSFLKLSEMAEEY